MLKKSCVERSRAGRGFTLPTTSHNFLVIAIRSIRTRSFRLTEGRLAPAQEAVQGAADCEGQVGPLDLPDLGGEAAGHDRGWVGQKAHAVRAGHSAASKVID